MSELKDMTIVAKQISNALEFEVDNTNAHELMEKIKRLSLLTPSAASMQANAKKMLLKKEKELIIQYEKQDIAPSILMRKISAECFEEAAWLVYSERLNANISHVLEGLRSSLSYIKCELEHIRQV